ncbi:MAG: hypothetical protein GXO36_04070 [Chloroflexi bacterium]|nr:hypothetical protein [Chloroflexota bacterium]
MGVRKRASLNPAQWVWLWRRPGSRSARARWFALAGVWLAAWLLLFGLVATLVLATWGLSWFQTLPRVQRLEQALDPTTGFFYHPTRYVAANGELLYPSPEATRPEPYIPLAALPQTVITTTLAAHDPDFWHEPGYRGAWWQVDQPPSLAQRLVRRFVLNELPEVSPWVERWFAAQAVRTYGHGQILAWFLNSAAYGPAINGIGQAARVYFGKTPEQLTWAEAALLAVQAGRSEPPGPEQARAARALLQNLAQQGRIPAQEVPDHVVLPDWQSATVLPPAVHAAQQDLVRELPTWPSLSRGLVVTVPWRADWARAGQCAMATVATLQRPASCPAMPELWLYRLDQPLPGVRMQVLALDAHTGDLLAWERYPNEASTEPWPVGMALAPWVYQVAFSRGWGPASLLWDLPESTPLGVSIQNHDGRYHGPLRARYALANAYEVPTFALANALSPVALWPAVQRSALPSLPPSPDLTPLLGEVVLTPLDLAYGLSPLATLGAQPYRTHDRARLPRVWLQAETAQGAALARVDVQTQPVLDPGVAYLVTHVLSDAPAHWPSLGARGPLDLEHVAVFVGRAEQARVVWVLMYTPERVAVVALDGREAAVDEAALFDAAQVLARAWAMTVFPASREPWPRPAQVVEVPVCNPSGLLPTPDCPDVVVEVFLKDQVPTQPDPYYRRLKINRVTGRLATIFTPPQWVEERVYFMWPPEARAWAEAQGLPVPPQEYDVVQPAPPPPGVVLQSPEMFAYVTGRVVFRGQVDAAGVQHYRIQIGQGPFPETWVVLAEGEAPRHGALAEWDTADWAEGLYTVQLLATDTQGRVRVHTIQLTVDHTPPRVRVRYPQPETAYCPVAPCGQAQPARRDALPIRIQAEDNLALAEVRAWLDGEFLAQWAAPPFDLAWPVQPGSHRLRVEARDQAGNRTVVEVPFEIQEEGR